MPVAHVEDDRLIVEVSSAVHPITAERYIEQVALEDGGRLEVVKLHPSDKPGAESAYHPDEAREEVFVGENNEAVPNCEANPCSFAYREGEIFHTMVYVFCGLHGLQRAEL